MDKANEKFNRNVHKQRVNRQKEMKNEVKCP